MEELYGGEDELLGQGSSMDPAGQPSGLASALTNPAERFDLAAGSSGGGWANKPSSSTQPTRAENSKWRNFPERDHTSEVRITIWNSTQQRKISGNAAPMEKNVDEYLRKHPDCAIYNGQDKNPGFHKSDMEDRASPRSRSAADRELDSQRRVSIWNRQDKRKLSGNCAPLERNLEQYLRDNPHCEVHHSEGKGKKVNKRPRKDGIGDGMSRASIHPGDVANGHQGFVHYDPFAGESIHNKSTPDPLCQLTPSMTVETLTIKPNPKIEGMVLPKFGVEGKMLTPPNSDKKSYDGRQRVPSKLID